MINIIDTKFSIYLHFEIGKREKEDPQGAATKSNINQSRSSNTNRHLRNLHAVEIHLPTAEKKQETLHAIIKVTKKNGNCSYVASDQDLLEINLIN